MVGIRDSGVRIRRFEGQASEVGDRPWDFDAPHGGPPSTRSLREGPSTAQPFPSAKVGGGGDRVQSDESRPRGSGRWGRSCWRPGKVDAERTGWLVGYLERDANLYFFAMNLEIREPGDAAARTSITRAILEELGLLSR